MLLLLSRRNRVSPGVRHPAGPRQSSRGFGGLRKLLALCASTAIESTSGAASGSNEQAQDSPRVFFAGSTVRVVPAQISRQRGYRFVKEVTYDDSRELLSQRRFVRIADV